jgi:hypothetical protein
VCIVPQSHGCPLQLPLELTLLYIIPGKVKRGKSESEGGVQSSPKAVGEEHVMMYAM